MFGKRKVRIDAELYQRLADAAAKAGYATTEEFIEHQLERAAEQAEEPADKQVIDQQLRGLGYLE